MDENWSVAPRAVENTSTKSLGTTTYPRRSAGNITLLTIGAETGMHLVALLPRGVSDVAISLKAAEMGISATPWSSCYAKPPRVGGLILGYGGSDARQIHDGIRRLAMCI